MLRIAPSARISKLADIEDSVRGSVIEIGERAVVDSFVKVKPAGGSGDVVIGADCQINSGCVLYIGNGIRMGRGCLIAANCTFAPTNHAFDDPDRFIFEQGFQPSRGGIVLEDDVWIGANSVLLDGVRIGRGAVIGAGAVVRGEVPAFAIAVGAPLRIIGRRGPGDGA
ncbi:acyltransferase [Oceanibacterium hippocampi]|uniref:Putative acetyltransferase n=1 Tax=Oceanibacterium hippocampi TaxID=745714 RepID=A0A1Y5TGJ2_9PROT|nr:acyltransferase [Oceanibacterium hippocampi]SLN63141.1 Putative acetyltransferase [Oceanibacterium hippocampi]